MSVMELAVFEDCRKLIDRFVNAGQNNFISFCKQWTALQFQHIYTAQTTYIEVMQTTAAIFHFAKRSLCYQGEDETAFSQSLDMSAENRTEIHLKEEDMRRRIGSLFLMYAIYFKQLTQRFVKIETSLNTWQQLYGFVNSLPLTPDMDDARFIFWCLLEADAFRFTALDYCVGLEGLVDYNKLNEGEESWRKEYGKSIGQQLNEYSEMQCLLPALSVLEDGYNEMKEMLLKTTDKSMHKQSLPSTTIFKNIEQSFQNIQAVIDNSEISVKNKSVNECKKRYLKRQGFKTARPLQTSDDETFDEDNPLKCKSLRRMSARTVFMDQLPMDLLEDLQQQETIETPQAPKTNEGEYSRTK